MCFVLLVLTEFVYLCVPVVAMTTRRVRLGRRGFALKTKKAHNARITLWRVRVTIFAVETQHHFLCVLLSPTSLLFINSFLNSTGMCRMRRFLAVLRNFFHSSLLCFFSIHPSPPTTLPFLSHLIFPSISWSISQSRCSQIHI